MWIRGGGGGFGISGRVSGRRGVVTLPHVDLPRSSGVQLHPTSLPGGRLGRDAYAWIDWLADAGQTWWQMLPLGPPDRYGSPYKARSAFAAWPGLLAEPAAPVSKAEELDFREREAGWIEDWARFAGRGAVADQVRFEREWAALRAHAADRGVRLIGDIPIYVAPASADHRAHPGLFRDDAVAGTPPDAFTDKGQLWGNPLYHWPALRRDGYDWWIRRLARTFAHFDLARIDHFRGFVAYWTVPKGARHALSGHWSRGPGRPLFDAARRRARRAADHRGGPRRDHARGPAAARRARAARHGRAPVRLRARASAPNVHDLANHVEHRVRLHGHARQRHAARLVRVAAGAAPRARRRRPPARGRGAVVGPDRARRSRRRRGSRWSRPRTSSGSAPRRA